MNNVTHYYDVNDQDVKKVLLKLFSSSLYPLFDLIPSESIIFIEKGADNEENLIKLARNNIVIFIDDMSKDFSHPHMNCFGVDKNFILNEQNKFRNLINFISEIFIRYESKIMDLEDKIFHLAFSSTDMLEKHENLTDQLSKDGLTGLYNHTAFQDRLKTLFEDYKNNGTVFSVAILDLDFFKKVNDTYGHLKGDEVLRKFAEEIKHSIRKDDFPCRYGGEEFTVLFPKIDKYEAEKILERLRNNFAKVEFSSNDKTFKVTFSAGISEINENIESASALLKNADTALYFSKHNGRNRTTLD
ncbi:MAG: hypothetical protein JG767_1486 [Deferribacteraceae bacterium]|jgi:diguanylate cyclase (GGDEF)-like protein|nr:hypothetical protein [Deferribacteraceae bacterium]